MTSEEIEISIALSHVTYLPGSYDKRFAHNMLSLLSHNPSQELTKNQKNQLYCQLHRYRRQVNITFENHKKECIEAIEKRKHEQKTKGNRNIPIPKNILSSSL